MEKDNNPSIQDTTHRRSSALVFISHDSRDAEIAEAFSRLLSSVSAGVLKSFRSSDKKGNQGIEYGIEWYPEIMKKLESASDVVCLLTPNSVNRPWILFEAGVAKGKLDTPVHGIALGISLNVAAIGPFAQFQNLDDEVDSLTGLVIQLVGRIPNAEPDRDVVRMQVESFKQKVEPLLKAEHQMQKIDEKQEEASVAKIFEEIKVMFQDLPARIEKRVDPEIMSARRRMRRFHPKFLEELLHVSGRETNENLSILIVASFFRDDFPWIYEVALDVYRKLEAGHPDAIESLKGFIRLFERTAHHQPMWEMGGRSKERRFELEETMMFAERLLDRIMGRQLKINTAMNTEKQETSQN